MRHISIPLLLSSILFYAVLCAEKVLIITHAFNRPEFISIQYHTFKKFLADDFEFVVFNDAPVDDAACAIKQACDECGVHCIRIPQEIHTRPYLPRNSREHFVHSANVRHAHNVQYSCDVLGFDHDGIVFIVDSDMFLVRPLNITEYMQDKLIAGLTKGSMNAQGKTASYICPALCFLYMNRLPDKRTLNFNCGFVEGDISVDSGGFTHYYLKEHPAVELHWVDGIFSHTRLGLGNTDCNVPIDETLSLESRLALYESHGFNKKEINFFLKRPDTFEYYLNKCFFHYHGGSNYTGQSLAYHEYKTRIFMEYIVDILSA